MYTLFLSQLLPCGVCVLLFILTPLFAWCLIHQSTRLPNRQCSSSPPPPCSFTHAMTPRGTPSAPTSILCPPLSDLSLSLSLHPPFLLHFLLSSAYHFHLNSLCFSSSLTVVLLYYFSSSSSHFCLSFTLPIMNFALSSHSLLLLQMPLSIPTLFILLLLH